MHVMTVLKELPVGQTVYCSICHKDCSRGGEWDGVAENAGGVLPGGYVLCQDCMEKVEEDLSEAADCTMLGHIQDYAGTEFLFQEGGIKDEDN